MLLRQLPPAVAGRFRAWSDRRRIQGYQPRVVEHSYGTLRLKVFVADHIAEEWYDRDWAALPELTALEASRLRAGARVFNLGAHHGVIALMLARIVGSTGHVVAVEPTPHNCAIAVKNRELNALPQIEVVQGAITAQPGTVVVSDRLCSHIDDGFGSEGRLVVQALTIDELAGRFGVPDVVFMDIEGAECLALAGAQRVLASGADFCIEMHPGAGLEKLGGTVAEVSAYFPPDRFRLWGRPDSDDPFRPFHIDEPYTRARFFLIALATNEPGP